MLRKLTAFILILAISLSLCACDDGNHYKTSGEPYINSKQRPRIIDGIDYETEENMTENFIAYKEDGKVMLYPINEKMFAPYDPNGLCNVKSGKAYTITYDAQMIKGGLAGKDERFFLTVYDYKECPYDKLFEKGYTCYTWKNKNMIGGTEDNPFVAFKSDWGGYDVFSPKIGKVHYQELRKIRFPVTVGDITEWMQFNVFCNWYISNDYVIEKMLGRNYDGGRDFIYSDCIYTHPDDTTGEHYYDSIEKYALGSGRFDNTMKLQFDEDPPEGRRVITYEEMSTLSREELGLSKDLYHWIYTGWHDRKEGLTSDYNQDWPPRKCDVLLFSGDFALDTIVTYDKDFRFNPHGYQPDKDEETFQYLVLFISTEFNDRLPQD